MTALFHLRVLAAALLCLTPSATSAGADPFRTDLDFTITRDGVPIGRHRIVLDRDGDTKTVVLTTKIPIPAAGGSVRRFDRTDTELWRGGRLVSLRAKTDQDGSRHTLAVLAAAGRLAVTRDGVASAAAAGAVPASLWSRDLLGRPVLPDTGAGQPLAVAVADLGREEIRRRGAPLAARHYRLSGGLTRDLWYGDDGLLAQLAFTGPDGARYLYLPE